MAVDLVIKGGKVVTAGHTKQAWIAVDGGKIVSIGSDQSPPEAKKIIDASGKYVLPGVVNPENHWMVPIEEGILQNTSVEACGGVTSVGCMMESNGMSLTPIELRTAEDIPLFTEILPPFIEAGNRLSAVDYMITPILQPKNLKEMPDLLEKLGITSFKLHMHLRMGERAWESWPYMKAWGAFFFDDEHVWRVMKKVASFGSPAILCMHNENWEIARVHEEELKAAGRKDIPAWAERSPDFCEAGVLKTYAYYAKFAGCPLYIMHNSTRETIKQIVQAKAEGTRLTAQTTPHYLLHTSDLARINTPLRSKEDNEAMWEALKTGVIDTMGNDFYWGNLTREKAQLLWKRLKESPETWNVWDEYVPFSGSSGFMLPVMLSEGVNKGRISLERLVEVCCEKTAKTFGLYPKKGAITVGADADFAIVDLDKTKVLTPDMIHNRSGISIYEGWELKGWPVMTILRGNVIMEWPEGKPRPEIVSEPVGHYLPRKPGHAVYPLD